MPQFPIEKFPLVSRRGFSLWLAAGAAWVAGGLSTRAHSVDQLVGDLKAREKYFQPLDRPAPDFAGTDAQGTQVSLQSLRGKTVVLFFVYTNCPDVCPLHAELIGKVQALVNQSPGGAQVQFVAITTDPANDSPAIMQAYGPAHGLVPSNWVFLTAGADQAARTKTLVARYGHKFTPQEAGYQLHGVVTHVIDKHGQWRANFHGMEFDPLNLVLYLNALTNENLDDGHPPAPTGIWQRIKSLF
ncbi:MAG: SCO family protein [Alphaproteobacteria bacterium]